jgi:hypothetical protein
VILPPASQLGLRALVLLGPLVALLASGPAGHAAPWLVIAATLALAAGGAWAPDSPVAAAPYLVVLGWWALALDEAVSGWAVLASAALLVAHVAGLLASYGPASMPLDAPTLRLWSTRGAVVLLTAPGAWLAARALEGEPEQPGIWVLGVAAAAAATVVATAALAVGRRDT